jgi:hypothetical protein
MSQKFIPFLIIFVLQCTVNPMFAGNPDRQGEAGAYELLINPWARSTGLNLLNAASVRGAEAMNLNVAGLSRINKLEVGVAHSIYLQGTGLSVNSLAIASKTGSGAFGISLNSMSFGDIPITTTSLPEGTGATFTPNFFNIALSYATTFENKVSVGVTLRGINEAINNVSAFGFGIDAGVQYVSGENDRFKLGIALKNTGSKMQYGGEGLVYTSNTPNPTAGYKLAVEQRAAQFELPSQLYLSTSYDIINSEDSSQSKGNRLTGMVSFISNSFSRDEIGGGLEYSLNKMFSLRGAYKMEIGGSQVVASQRTVHTGLAAGLSVELPLKKGSDTMLGIDYSYLASNPFKGTHNISFRLNL